ncbi:expressed protein [Phakopsora pachyrhizi]|uniref:Expressed protein n=1 Tax=Phakopsora pachyrhizi TaxID=170000 RepID=A0AAV0AL28_PHAPC|nr:expressed protein [Phakopsora pachyrhizi]
MLILMFFLLGFGRGPQVYKRLRIRAPQRSSYRDPGEELFISNTIYQIKTEKKNLITLNLKQTFLTALTTRLWVTPNRTIF